MSSSAVREQDAISLCCTHQCIYKFFDVAFSGKPTVMRVDKYRARHLRSAIERVVQRDVINITCHKHGFRSTIYRNLECRANRVSGEASTMSISSTVASAR